MNRKLLGAVFTCASLLAPLAMAHDFDGPLGRIATYQAGQNREPLTQVEDMAVKVLGNPGERAKLAADLAHLLESGHATPDAQQFICRQLAIVGGPAQVPALARLLAHPETADMARIALHAIPGHESGRALLAALKTATVETQAGIVTSLGVRKTTRAAGPIAKRIGHPDKNLSLAAIAALGEIGTPKAARLLRQSARRAPADQQEAIAHARIEAAVALRSGGHERLAARIYEDLGSPSQPDAIRTAAFLSGSPYLPDPQAVQVPEDPVKRKAGKRHFHQFSEHLEQVAERQ